VGGSRATWGGDDVGGGKFTLKKWGNGAEVGGGGMLGQIVATKSGIHANQVGNGLEKNGERELNNQVVTLKG